MRSFPAEKISALLMLVLLAGCAAGVADSGPVRNQNMIKENQRKNPPRIAVVGFDVAVSGYDIKNMDRKTEELLTNALVRTRKFSVIDRRNIRKVLTEQKFQQSGMVDTATAVKIGKILGAELIVTGAITELGCSAVSFIAKVTTCRASVDVQMIRVETAEIIAAETGEGRSQPVAGRDANRSLRDKDKDLWVSEALRSASDNAAEKLMNLQ